MTLEEKAAVCHAAGKFNTGGVERLGVPPMVLSDGPHGVRGELEAHSWNPLDTDEDRTTYLPVGVVLAATWNPDLAEEFGRVLGSEARARGKDMILGPGFNLIRDPLCGRNFEYFAEDPCLVSKLVPEQIRGIQAMDTAACAKHFALNNQELNRNGYSAEPDERTLREVYLPAFEAAVKEGGTLGLMGAYNKFYGQWCCHNRRLLVEILKEEWGFEGAVVSDWDATHDTDEAAENGLDIEMGTSVPTYEDYHLGRPLLEGIREGRYEEAWLDDKVRRVLGVLFAVGAMGGRERKPGRRHPPEHCAAGRRIAEEGVVLLRNEGLLPLDASKIRKLAVIGDNADRVHGAGGGSSGVKAFYEISPLEALRERFGERMEILHSRGYPEEGLDLRPIPDHHLATVDEGSGVKGWRVEWFANEADAPERTEFREQAPLTADEPVLTTGLGPYQIWRAEWSAGFIVPKDGTYVFALRCNDRAVLQVDGRTLLDIGPDRSGKLCQAEVELSAGRRVPLRLRYHHGTGQPDLQLGCYFPGDPPRFEARARDEALAVAREADAVLFFGGLNHFYDNEGKDRSAYGLPGGQDALIEDLVEANPRTAVMLVAGSAHAMPWADRVPAILLGGYAGMDAGRVFADLLFGEVNPSGKLPYTIARRLEDYPARALDDYRADRLRYPEGLLCGHRWFDAKGIEPLFPFGHGLGYSRFALSEPRLEAIVESGVRLSVMLRNQSERAGKTVVQLYLEGRTGAPDRPPGRSRPSARSSSGPANPNG